MVGFCISDNHFMSNSFYKYMFTHDDYSKHTVYKNYEYMTNLSINYKLYILYLGLL